MSSIPRGSDFVHGLKDPQNILIPHGIHKTVEARNEKARANKDQVAEINAENEAAQNANLDIAAMRKRRRASSLFAGGRSIIGAPAGRGAPAGGGAGGSSGSVFSGAGGTDGGTDYSGYAAAQSSLSRSFGGASRL